MTGVIPYWHVDAFAGRPFSGNQAAVMLLEAWPQDDVLRAIAAENMFAETAFLVPDRQADADWELRWFTPACEVALCGHATLASGHVLLGQEPGRQAIRFRTRKSGVLEVRRDATGYALSLPAIPMAESEWPDAVAALGWAVQSVHRNPAGYALFLYEDETTIRELRPDMAALVELGGDTQFIATAPGDATDVVSRVFVPGAGVDEDSVTGSAHAVLAPFWAARLGRAHFTAFQASERGGKLTCRLDGERVWLSGPCVTVVEGVFRLGPQGLR